MKIGYVYMITCIITGKIYIGSTKDFKERMWYYEALRCKKQQKLYNSIMKYGWENHHPEIIWTGDINQMLAKECILGNWFEVLDKFKGLNLRLPKIDDVYQTFSDETRKKLSVLGKARGRMKQESIDKMKATKKKQGITPENRAKMVANMRKGPHPEEWNRKISEGNKGKIVSEEAIKNMTKRKVKCSITGEEMSIKQAAIKTGYSYNHMNNMLMGIKTNKTSFYYIN